MAGAVQDWFGACAFLDVLGFKSLSREHRSNPACLIDRLAHVAKRAENEDGGYNYQAVGDGGALLDDDMHVIVVSDGMFIFSGIHPQGDKTVLMHKDPIWGIATVKVARVVAHVLKAGAETVREDTPAFVYRGAIAVGAYHYDGERFFVGEAPFEAVAGESEIVDPCVWLTPRAAQCYSIARSEPEFLKTGGRPVVVETSIGLKGGGTYKGLVVNPLAAAAPPEREGLKTKLKSGFGSSYRVDVASKRQWFERFLDVCELDNTTDTSDNTDP